MSTLTERLRIAGKAAVGIFSEQSMQVAFGLLRGVLPGGMGTPPTRGTPEYLRAYSEMPWLRAVASRISTAVATSDWQLFVARKGGKKADGSPLHKARLDGTVKRIQRSARPQRVRLLKQLAAERDLDQITEHPLLDVLTNANEFQTGLGMRKVTQLHLDLVGDAFWLKERDAQGTVVGVWPIPPHWIQATPTPAFRFFRVSFRAWRGIIPDTEFIWFSDDDPLNPYGRGTGVARALADELETDEYTAKHTRSFFYNQARPDLLVWPKGGGNLQPSNIARLEEDWLAKNQGFWKCHDAETEVLTIDGWRLGTSLSGHEQIATWNEEAQRLEYQTPSALHSYEYDGVMQHWHGGHIDALVTPNHRMWWGDKDGRWRFDESARLAARGSPVRWREAGFRETPESATVTIAPISWCGIGRPPKGLDDALSFEAVAIAPIIGYIATEGSVEPSRVRIYQLGQNARKQKIVEAIDASTKVFSASCVSVDEDTVEHEWTVAHKGFATWAAEHIGVGAENKHLPREVFNWPRDAREALLNALILGDGGWSHEAQESGTFWTTSERLADDVQRLSVELGWRSRKLLTTNTTPNGPCVHWRVSIAKFATRWMQKRNRLRANSGWADEVQYRGTVWCVTVPNGTLLTRRNGCPVISGNSFKPYFLSREVEVKELDSMGNFRALQLTQLRQFERDTILQVFGIPPEILGVLENSNRATIDAADYLMSRYVVEPRLEFMRATLQERLCPEYDERLIIEYTSPVAEDTAQRLAAATAAPWAPSIDEWRQFQGLPPLENEIAGQQHMVPVQAQPMTLTGEEPVPPPMPVLPPAVGAGRRGIALDGLSPWDRGDTDVAVAAGDLALAEILQKATSLDLAALPAPSAIAARQEPALARLLREAWKTHAARVSLTALEAAVGAAGTTGDVLAALDLPGLAATQSAAIAAPLRRGFMSGADLGARTLQRAGIPVRRSVKAAVAVDFAAVNAAAVAWVEAHIAALVAAPADVRAAIAQLVARSIADGVTPQQLARQIRNIIGLTPQQVEAVGNFYTRLVQDASLAESVIWARTERYADAQRAARAFTIARTELIAALNHGQQALWAEAVAQGAIQTDEFEQVWIVTEDDRLDAEICEPLADATAAIGGLFPGGIDAPPAHPNCLVHGRTPIYTSEGWRPIKDIAVGDLVLTHRGRFKKVVQIHRHTSQEPTVKLWLHNRRHKLSLTANHPVLVSWGRGKWVNAGSLRVGDKVKMLSKPCALCGKPTLEGEYCGNSCATRGAKKWLKANEGCRRRVLDGVFVLQRPETKVLANRAIASRNYSGSWLERKVGNALRRLGLEPIRSYPIPKTTLDSKGRRRHWFVDYAFPDLKIAIEVDGSHWHSSPEAKDRDGRRQADIEAQGWTVLRFSDVQINADINACAEEVARIANNHAQGFSFGSFDVVDVKTIARSQPYPTYNLSVEDDESYVAKKVVVHNCRCAVGLQATSAKAARVPTIEIHNHLPAHESRIDVPAPTVIIRDGPRRVTLEHDEHGRTIGARIESDA